MSGAGVARRSWLARRGVEFVGFAVLLYLAYAGFVSLWPGSDGYVPASADAFAVTAAPGLSVEVLPSARTLSDVRFDGFDVAPSGAVIVSSGGRLADMSSGEDLFPGGEKIRSFAFVGDALAAVDAAGNIGFYDGGRFRAVGPEPLPGSRLVPSGDRTRLFVLRGDRDDGRNIPALAALRGDAEPEILTGSFAPLQAVGGDLLRAYFAEGEALFQIVTPGRPSLLLALPDPRMRITGIAVSGTAVYFATGRAVYALEDGLAVPLAIGVGGDIRVVAGALYVLDPARGRVYRISHSGTDRR